MTPPYARLFKNMFHMDLHRSRLNPEAVSDLPIHETMLD